MLLNLRCFIVDFIRMKQLCMSPTPIHKWTPPNIPDGFEVSIKREDLTGSTLSGNKVIDKVLLSHALIHYYC